MFFSQNDVEPDYFQGTFGFHDGVNAVRAPTFLLE